MFFMTVSPIILGVLLRKGYKILMKEYSFLTYNYLGFITIFFCLSICIHLFTLVFRGKTYALINFLISTILAIVICLYSFYESENIKVEKITINTPKISSSIKIGFLSDLHHGHLVGDDFVKEVIKKLEEEKIDLLLLGGDILEVGWDNSSELWNRYNPPLGKYAISGNHEFYLGYEKSKQIFEKMGVSFIDNKVIQIKDINIIGLPDEVYKTQFGGKIEEISNLKYDAKKFTILLKHRPRVLKNEKIDLQLSGHTHKGQILPFQLITKIFYPIHSGMYEIEKDYKVYVSRGIGTWGPRMRLLSRPEVTIINLTK